MLLKAQQSTGVRCPVDHNPELTDLEAVAMTQYGLKRSLKEFGDNDVKAAQRKLKQVHNMGVVKPVFGILLTHEQKKDALHYLMFLKKKRCGRIKGHGCADRRKQQQHTTKE